MKKYVLFHLFLLSFLFPVKAQDNYPVVKIQIDSVILSQYKTPPVMMGCEEVEDSLQVECMERELEKILYEEIKNKRLDSLYGSGQDTLVELRIKMIANKSGFLYVREIETESEPLRSFLTDLYDLYPLRHPAIKETESSKMSSRPLFYKEYEFAEMPLVFSLRAVVPKEMFSSEENEASAPKGEETVIPPVFPGCENRPPDEAKRCFSIKLQRYVHRRMNRALVVDYLKTKYQIKELMRFVVHFTVGEQGEITDIKVVPGNMPEISEEFIRVFKSLPTLTPPRKGNHPSRMKMRLPLIFRMD